MVRTYFLLMLVLVVMLGLGAQVAQTLSEVAEDDHVAGVTAMHYPDTTQSDGDHCGHLVAHMLGALSRNAGATFDLYGGPPLTPYWLAFCGSHDPAPPYRPPILG